MFSIFKNKGHYFYQIYFLDIYFVLLLEYSCFTMLYQSLLYNKVNQLYVYIYLIPLAPPFHLLHRSRSSQSTRLSSLCSTAASHQLYILHMAVYIYVSAAPPILSTLPFPLYVLVHSLCLCLYSCPANSCVSIHLYHISRFHICMLKCNICFSLSLFSLLCMTDSRFIHITTNDPILFLFMAK